MTENWNLNDLPCNQASGYLDVKDGWTIWIELIQQKSRDLESVITLLEDGFSEKEHRCECTHKHLYRQHISQGCLGTDKL